MLFLSSRTSEFLKSLTNAHDIRDYRDMDPKQNGNQPLDPKLQQAYDRVMGVSLTGDPQASSPQGQAAPASTTPIEPTAIPAAPSLSPLDPMATPSMPDPMTTAPASPSLVGSATPTMPSAPPDPIAGVSPMVTVSLPPTEPSLLPAAGPTVSVTPTPTLPEQPAPAAPMPAMPQDSLRATINIPVAHDNQTVKIGIGGSPVGVAAKVKGKGISPVILIFGAIAFLVVYGVFWVKFFGYSLPFMPQ